MTWIPSHSSFEHHFADPDYTEVFRVLIDLPRERFTTQTPQRQILSLAAKHLQKLCNMLTRSDASHHFEKPSVLTDQQR